MYNICLCFDPVGIKAENAWILLQVKFLLYVMQTKVEHSSGSIGRILLQVKFFYLLSQQNLSIAPASMGGYCLKFFFKFYPNKM